MSGLNTKNFIEINGKRFDAVNGAFLGNVPALASTHPAGHSRRQTIDGFVRVNRSSQPTPVKLQPTPAAHKAAAPQLSMQPVKAATHSVAHKPHTAAAHAKPHSPQKATTLMRSAVTKPDIKSPKTIKAQSRTDILAKIPLQTVVPKISYNSINKARHERAERLIKSPAVSRYSPPSVVAPAQLAASASRPVQVVQATQQATQTVSAASVAQAFAPAQPAQRLQASPVRPAASRYAASGLRSPALRPQQQQPPVVAVAVPRPVQSQPDIFEQALAAATSHEQTYNEPKRARKNHLGLRIASASLVALVLIGAIVFHNTSKISVAVASYRAGLHAKLPAQDPAGFSFGYLDYKPGNVTVNYTSKDSHQFNITQKASSWDSQALLSNFVSTTGGAYKTYQQAGRTVYVLDNNTATWVDSGVWYTVDGNSSLSSRQLLDLAGSM